MPFRSGPTERQGSLVHGQSSIAGTAVVAAVAGKLDRDRMAADPQNIRYLIAEPGAAAGELNRDGMHACTHARGYRIAQPSAAAGNSFGRADDRTVHFEGQRSAEQSYAVRRALEIALQVDRPAGCAAELRARIIGDR